MPLWHFSGSPKEPLPKPLDLPLCLFWELPLNWRLHVPVALLMKEQHHFHSSVWSSVSSPVDLYEILSALNHLWISCLLQNYDRGKQYSLYRPSALAFPVLGAMWTRLQRDGPFSLHQSSSLAFLKATGLSRSAWQSAGRPKSSTNS